jgi:hypothetical protein
MQDYIWSDKEGVSAREQSDPVHEQHLDLNKQTTFGEGHRTGCAKPKYNSEVANKMRNQLSFQVRFDFESRSIDGYFKLLEIGYKIIGFCENNGELVEEHSFWQ